MPPYPTTRTERQAGFSMMAAVFAVAMSALVVTGVSKVLDNSRQLSRNMKQVTEYSQVRSNIAALFSNQNACTRSFQTLTSWPAVGAASVGWQPLTVKNPNNANVFWPSYKANGIEIKQLRADTGTTTTGMYSVKVEIVVDKVSQPGAEAIGKTTMTDTLYVNVKAPGGVVSDCIFQTTEGFAHVDSQSHTIPSVPIGTSGDALMMPANASNGSPASGYTVVRAVVRDGAGKAQSEKLDFKQHSPDILAKGTRWVLSASGDAQGVTRDGPNASSSLTWPWTCAWLYVVVHKAGNRAAVVADEPIGFVCNGWGRPSRSDIVVNNLLLGQSYTIQPYLLRNVDGVGDERYASSEGINVTVDQFVAIKAPP